MKPVLVGLGEILWDLLPSGKQLGGAPCNFAYHANALGGHGITVSCIGADKLGREILKRLKKLSLECNHIAVDTLHPTGTVSVQIDAAGKPTYIIHEKVAWDFIPNSPQLVKLAKKVNAVCFGSLAQRTKASRATIHWFLKKTSAKTLRIFDINLRQSFYSREIIDTSLQLANILKINDEELPVVGKLLKIKGNETALLKELTCLYRLRLIALTKGNKGSVLFSNGASSYHSGYRAQVVDTVGAGDAFTAALAMGMLRGYDLDRINDNANRIAVHVCSRPGATPKLSRTLCALFKE